MKLICPDCKAVFDEEDAMVFWEEPHDELDGRPVEHFAGRRCPECGCEGEFLEEARECIYCGEGFDPDDLNAGVICDKCLEEIIHNRTDLTWYYLYSAARDEFAEWLEHADKLGLLKN